MDNSITRNEAIETLYDLMNSGVLSEEIECKLQEIANNIENENYGLHLWGADNEEYAVLVTAVREDEVTEEYIANGKRIWKKYSYAPSPFEEKEIEDNLREAEEE